MLCFRLPNALSSTLKLQSLPVSTRYCHAPFKIRAASSLLPSPNCSEKKRATNSVADSCTFAFMYASCLLNKLCPLFDFIPLCVAAQMRDSLTVFVSLGFFESFLILRARRLSKYFKQAEQARASLALAKFYEPV